MQTPCSNLTCPSVMIRHRSQDKFYLERFLWLLKAIFVLKLQESPLDPLPLELRASYLKLLLPHDLRSWLPTTQRTSGNGARLPWPLGGQEGAVSNWQSSE